MASRSRRAFLKGASLTSAALLASTPETHADHADSPDSKSPLEHDLLLSVARVVLPSELGDEGIASVVNAFQTWLSEYDPVPELMHPYGEAVPGYGPPDPAPRWQAQLDAMQIECERRFAVSFLSANDEQQKTVILSRLSQSGDRDLSAPLSAQHVGVGLLAYYVGTSAAIDRCYGRRIAKLSCRGLPGSEEIPVQLS